MSNPEIWLSSLRIRREDGMGTDARTTEFSAATADNPRPALNFTLQRYLALRKQIAARASVVCSFDPACTAAKRKKPVVMTFSTGQRCRVLLRCDPTRLFGR